MGGVPARGGDVLGSIWRGDGPAGQKNPPDALETTVDRDVEGMGRDRYGIAIQYCLRVFC